MDTRFTRPDDVALFTDKRFDWSQIGGTSPAEGMQILLYAVHVAKTKTAQDAARDVLLRHFGISFN